MGKWKQAMLDTEEFVDTMIGAPMEQGCAPDGCYSVGATIRLGVARYVEKTEARFAELGEMHRKHLERLQQSSSVSLNSMAQQLYTANNRAQELNAQLEQQAISRDVQREHTQARRLLRDALGYKDREQGGDEPGLVGLVEELIALAQRVPERESAKPTFSGPLDYDDGANYLSRTRVRDTLRNDGITSVTAAVERAVARAKVEIEGGAVSVWLRDVYKLIHDVDVGYMGDSAYVKRLLTEAGFAWWPWATEEQGRRYIRVSDLEPGDWSRIVVWFLDAHSYAEGGRTLVDANAAWKCFRVTYGDALAGVNDEGVWDQAIMHDQKVWECVGQPCTWARRYPLN